MIKDFDIKFARLTNEIKVGHIVLKNNSKCCGLNYRSVGSQITTEKELDAEIDRLIGELEILRKKAKEEFELAQSCCCEKSPVTCK